MKSSEHNTKQDHRQQKKEEENYTLISWFTGQTLCTNHIDSLPLPQSQHGTAQSEGTTTIQKEEWVSSDCPNVLLPIVFYKSGGNSQF
mmetsp:Transcript_27012/g.42183  ORF Transcript_27012/g.42183 Transcript_27012/m.42183 type:complete len:88 (-) Transcript_27012:12-275(-)